MNVNRIVPYTISICDEDMIVKWSPSLQDKIQVMNIGSCGENDLKFLFSTFTERFKIKNSVEQIKMQLTNH